MADVADIASDIEQERIARILNNRQQNTNEPSAVDCEECGDAIPEARRIALLGVKACVHCQALNEASDKWRK